MNLINNNPFRILGLPITASEREIAKQINSLVTYAEMGKSKTFDTDFTFLNPIDRTPDTIEEAKKQIEQSESKLLYSLFWFWNNNSVDELALEVLKEGKTNKAIEIWEKIAFSNKNKVYKPLVLFENLIRQKTSWSEVDNDDHTLHKNEDEYIIERKNAENYSIPTEFCELNFEENWSIECDITWIDGVDNSSYGIVFGREKGSYYFFGVAGSGSFMYAKYNDWTFMSNIDWKDTPEFNKWSTNHLQINKSESQLDFFVNDVLVGTFQAEPFFGKYFGFKVSKNQKISFRNFKFSKLVEDETYGEGINITSKNSSSIKNLSTLYLSLATNNGTLQLDYFNKGVALAKAFFTDENIENYTKRIAGERYIYNSEKVLHFYINDIVDSLRKYLEETTGIKTSELINAFSSFPLEAKQFLNNRFVAKQIQNIEKEIELSQIARKDSPSNAIETGKKLFTNIQVDFSYLKNVLGVNDFQYQIIADKLSVEIVQCGIDSYNSFKNSNGETDYAKAIKSEESYLIQYEYALSIAVNARAKERARENFDSCVQFIKNKHLYNCWFCGNNPHESASKFTITIYKETSRSYFPRKVQYKYVPVSIPRCSDCQKVHSQSSSKFALSLIICLVIGLIIGILADGYWFLGLLIGGVVGWILGEVLKSQQTSKSEIKNTSQSTIKNYPEITQMLKEGWQFSQPSA